MKVGVFEDSKHQLTSHTLQSTTKKKKHLVTLVCTRMHKANHTLTHATSTVTGPNTFKRFSFTH